MVAAVGGKGKASGVPSSEAPISARDRSILFCSGLRAEIPLCSQNYVERGLRFGEKWFSFTP
jgi:hypothetical protein